ncbi:MAG TPA: GGDEF domain-containing protein [Bryobacteraceae bacterium]|nr:GGDEF domain-containing protein [Bryobacteraceae bacterium]
MKLKYFFLKADSLTGQHFVISNQSSLSELESCHRLGAAVLDCYVTGIKNIAHYAVELDSATTAPHRRHLSALAAEVADGRPDALAESRATLRGLLREYRDKAAAYLNGLRSQLSSTAQALQDTVEALSQSDGDHTATLRTALARLREVAKSPEGCAVGAVVNAAADSIEQSLEQIRKQHQFTISQFQTEIRLLHSRIESLETAAALDQATRVANRSAVSEYIRSLQAGGASILLLKASGLLQAKAKFGLTVADDLAATLARRLRNSLPKEAILGRWNENAFLAILAADRPGEVLQPKLIADHLSTPYACMRDGKVVRIPVTVTAEFLPVAADDPPNRILERIDKAFG